MMVMYYSKILNNVMTNGDTGVYSNAAEHVKISGNEFNNIETVAVWVEEGDADITDNEIYNSGGAIIADSMTKPISDAPFRLAAGVNTGQPESASFYRFHRRILKRRYYIHPVCWRGNGHGIPLCSLVQ